MKIQVFSLMLLEVTAAMAFVRLLRRVESLESSELSRRIFFKKYLKMDSGNNGESELLLSGASRSSPT